jgi:signal peptidase I
MHAESRSRHFHAYRGGSMLGTLHRGDRVPIEPVPIAAIRPGDVVAFLGANGRGEPQELVHRTIALRPGGLVTRGDNNLCVDDALVTADKLLGRVTHVEREGRIRRVRGGCLGLLRGRVLHARIHARALAVAVGRGPYGWLRRSGLAPRLWRPTITRLQVATEKGPLIKYLSRGRTVARWWPAQGRFECDRPYDLVIPRPTGGE